MNLLDRFLKYASIPTFSDSNSLSTPSTKEQIEFATLLIEDLKSVGANVQFDLEHGYIYAVLKGNIEAPSLGFIAHLDTSEDARGDKVTPKVIKNYDGRDIYLNSSVITKVSDNPDLLNYKGKTLITSDGTTLLGADDKAGIVEIIEMLDYFNSSLDSHGDIYVCFTPDEEIGRGTSYFDFSKFPVQFAYTVDGKSIGEIAYENFNAARVEIKIKGTPSHLGYAKGILINALSIANKIISLVPEETPENTEGHEGFYHLHKINGDFGYCKMEYLIRDFDIHNFQRKKEKFRLIAERLNKEYGNAIEVNITDSYYNMRDAILNNFHLVEIARLVMENLGVTPISLPIRGGTDGARLSNKGLPCPNIGTGVHNLHSVYEYIAWEDMAKVSEILIGIVKEYARDKDIVKRIRN